MSVQQRYDRLDDGNSSRGEIVMEDVIRGIRKRHGWLLLWSLVAAVALLSVAIVLFVDARARGISNTSDVVLNGTNGLAVFGTVFLGLALFHGWLIVRAGAVVKAATMGTTFVRTYRASGEGEVAASFCEEEWGANAELREKGWLKFNQFVPPYRAMWSRRDALLCLVLVLVWPVVAALSSYRMWLHRPFPSGLLWVILFSLPEAVFAMVLVILIQMGCSYYALRRARQCSLPPVVLSREVIVVNDTFVNLRRISVHCDRNRVIGVVAVHPDAPQRPYIQIEYYLVIGKLFLANPFLLRFPVASTDDVDAVAAHLNSMWQEDIIMPAQEGGGGEEEGGEVEV